MSLYRLFISRKHGDLKINYNNKNNILFYDTINTFTVLVDYFQRKEELFVPLFHEQYYIIAIRFYRVRLLLLIFLFSNKSHKRNVTQEQNITVERILMIK